jgi:DNA-binding LytR/AlgR family response regulator
MTSPDWDILFTDIAMPASNAIQIVKNLRRFRYFPVVFITESTEYAIDAFEVNALHYLVKPVCPGAIVEALNRCLGALNRLEEPILQVKTLHRTVPVAMCQITYIEVFNNLSVIHTISDQFRTYTPLKNLFESLDKNLFMKPHRSYIVNMNHIQSFHFDHIILDNGMKIVLSRKNRSDLKQQHQSFLFRQTQNGSL